LFVTLNLSAFVVPVLDGVTHSLISAQTTNDIIVGIDRAQEAVRAFNQSIKLYQNAMDRFNKLQDLYKNNIEQNRLIDTIRGYKGDPQKLVGILGRTKKAVRKYGYYSNRYYQNPEAIVTDQKLWNNFENTYGKVDNVTYRFTGNSAEQHYENLQELATGYYEYNDLIKENIKKLNNFKENILLRTPLIPGFTATKNNLQEIGAFNRELTLKNENIEFELINYNPYAKIKYKKLGLEFDKAFDRKKYTDEEMKYFYTLFK